MESDTESSVLNGFEPPTKRGRGRPRKHPADLKVKNFFGPKRPRGRPRKFFAPPSAPAENLAVPPPTPAEESFTPPPAPAEELAAPAVAEPSNMTCFRCNDKDVEGCVVPEFDVWMCWWCATEPDIPRCECGNPSILGLELMGAPCRSCLKKETEDYFAQRKVNPAEPLFRMVLCDI